MASNAQKMWCVDSDVREAFAAWSAWFLAVSLTTARALGMSIPYASKDRRAIINDLCDATMRAAFGAGLVVSDEAVNAHYFQEGLLFFRSEATLDRKNHNVTESVDIGASDASDDVPEMDLEGVDVKEAFLARDTFESARKILAETLPDSCLETLVAMRKCDWNDSTGKPNLTTLATILGVTRPAASMRYATLQKHVDRIKATLQ